MQFSGDNINLILVPFFYHLFLSPVVALQRAMRMRGGEQSGVDISVRPALSSNGNTSAPSPSPPSRSLNGLSDPLPGTPTPLPQTACCLLPKLICLLPLVTEQNNTEALEAQGRRAVQGNFLIQQGDTRPRANVTNLVLRK